MKTTEAQEQEAIFAWAAIMERRYPELRLLHHIPNGGSRHPIEAARLKKQGVKAGMPDICLPVSRNGYNALYIELKRKGGRVSERQQEMMMLLTEYGNMAIVCYGTEQAVECIVDYLRGEKNG